MPDEQPELLIDWIYRDTFRAPRNPELRRLLTSARRCVLSDEMAAFLYTLMVEIYAGKPGKFLLRRTHRRLDDCRHFSRLPHRLTWVEYSLNAMLVREEETKGQPIETRSVMYQDIDDGVLRYSDIDHHMVQSTQRRPRRVGWLLMQHDKIETAFRADYFIGGLPPSGKPKWTKTNMSLIWCPDEEPMPVWPGPFVQQLSALIFPSRAEDPEYQHTEGLTQSEYVTGVRGYERDNVGMLFFDRTKSNLPDLATGRARMIWAFLSTFNKVPIVGEQKIVPSRGFVARGAYHRFLEHKVLTISVPEKAGLRKVARQALAVIRRRAHQVRGHWRDDWKLPKGNKSLWIAEHQRGDASLGFVTHDYKVEHDTP
jgi:hypothetical protein